jgi:nucleotide-binding universal stress UspA family protein
MLVIMALVTTFMTSPLIELIYQKKPSQIEPLEATELSSSVIPSYSILVPVANPNTQQGLVKLAVAIAYGTQSNLDFVGDLTAEKPKVAVFPLSLIEVEVEYLYESLPQEAAQAIKSRQNRLQELILSLEPPEVREIVHPIVRVCGDIARTTAAIAKNERTNLMILGWHHPVFMNNRLGGTVGQILNAATTDIAIYFESRQQEGNGDRGSLNFTNLLVPYAGNVHDHLALELAIRLLLNHPSANLRVLRVAKDIQPSALQSRSFMQTLELLSPQISDRIKISLVSNNAISAVIEASETADLTIAGVSREWGLERRTFGKYTDQLAVKCQSAMLITRKHKLASSHLSGILTEVKDEQSMLSS